MAHSLSSAGTPMALSTWLGPTLPDEQADPDETEIPLRSSPIIATEFLSPGTAKFERVADPVGLLAEDHRVRRQSAHTFRRGSEHFT